MILPKRPKAEAGNGSQGSFFVIKITGKNCPKLGNLSMKLHETEKINATECIFAFFR